MLSLSQRNSKINESESFKCSFSNSKIARVNHCQIEINGEKSPKMAFSESRPIVIKTPLLTEILGSRREVDLKNPNNYGGNRQKTCSTLYYYCGQRVCEEQDEFGNFKRDYVHGGQFVDEVVMTSDVAGSIGNFTLTDLRYSVYAVVDSDGTILERYRYDPYGSRTVMNAGFGVLAKSSVSQEFGYTGRRHDVEDTGLMYFRARYYSGELGRFVNRDPLGYVDGMSLYRGYFVVNGVDPSGMIGASTGSPSDRTNPRNTHGDPTRQMADRHYAGLTCSDGTRVGAYVDAGLQVFNCYKFCGLSGFASGTKICSTRKQCKRFSEFIFFGDPEINQCGPCSASCDDDPCPDPQGDTNNTGTEGHA